MLDGFEDLVKTRPDYRETILSCIVACELVEKKDPLNVLETHQEYKSYNHGISKLAKYDLDGFSYLICDCSTEKKKNWCFPLALLKTLPSFFKVVNLKL